MKTNKSVAARFSAVAVYAGAILAIAAATWLIVAARPALAAGDAIVVIVNSANPVEDLSVGDLKKLFLSDRSRWDTGKAVAPVMVAAGAPERTSFLKIVCGMNDGDFSKYFLAAAFAGKSATPPKEVGSAGAVKSFVAGSAGGIGFVRVGDFGTSESGIKAVKVGGTSAADPAYKLKM
jgi:ABC-type phosphate transport system substrate-binding protein